ncbi:hypothetical protein EVAR_74496_1 [Eumeta japonica]|uniref:Uncharacterized protein n=1 Tax=Eumeta variegata TaxID=151549 RepID=A0A4C1TCJ1_EUMVA|nr:hypothetical protein EVAR_74496_1 [Eumeta japonica]
MCSEPTRYGGCVIWEPVDKFTNASKHSTVNGIRHRVPPFRYIHRYATSQKLVYVRSSKYVRGGVGVPPAYCRGRREAQPGALSRVTKDTTHRAT